MLEKKRVPWWWVIVPILVSILISGGGIYYGWAQAVANADHKVIVQRIQMSEDAISRDEDLITSNTFAINDLAKNMAVLQGQLTEIINILKGAYK